MKLMIKIFACFLLVSGLSGCQPNTNDSPESSTQEPEKLRIVSLSGFLTEVAYELGLGDQLVGRDVTSTYPESAQELPNLGHVTQLNLEALLGLSPNVILVEEKQLGQIQQLPQLEASGIELIVVPTHFHFNNALLAAKQLQQTLAIPENAIDQMESQIEQDSIQLLNTIATEAEQPRVLFIYARGAGRLMVAGQQTAAAAMIKKAGGINSIQSFEQFKPLSPEALLEANPDVILMFTSGLASLDGKAGLEQITGIAETTAFRENRIIAMDGHYLTAFGPRAAAAATELADQLHKEAL